MTALEIDIYPGPQSEPTPLLFPHLDFLSADLQVWPRPRALQNRAQWPLHEGAQACRIETRTGSFVEGELVALDMGSQTLMFRTREDGPSARLPFARMRSLTLTAPIVLAGNPAQIAATGRHDEPGDCSFSLEWLAPGQSNWSGSTAGYSVTRDGLFLFPSSDGFATVERTFVPGDAYRSLKVDTLKSPAAESNGISELQQLLRALDAQETAPVLRIGESLVDLGLLSQAQLEAALAAQSADVPLGEMLVSAGAISRSDLMTGLAHKMGYPFVDLRRFPVDFEVAKLLPSTIAAALCAMPIAIDAKRLIVITDRPTSLTRLRGLIELAPYKVVIGVAPAAQIREAISALPGSDPWAANVPMR